MMQEAECPRQLLFMTPTVRAIIKEVKMRMIKFRGKCVDNGELVFDSLGLTDNQAVISWDRTDSEGVTFEHMASEFNQMVRKFVKTEKQER